MTNTLVDTTRGVESDNASLTIAQKNAAWKLSLVHMRAVVAVAAARKAWLFELHCVPCPSMDARPVNELLERWAQELGVSLTNQAEFAPYPPESMLHALLAMEAWRAAKGA